jgi:formylglycine-generating enzyme required for sulfatase activity
MDVHEVTNMEYAACVTAGACTAPQHTRSSTRLYYYGQAEYENYPVLYVDWQQAVDFCTWEGKRLPSEAEWEYAARGGLGGARYPWGNSISGSDANYLNSGDPEDNDTNEVGSYPANGYGLYDVSGNVYEWVNDLYDNLYYYSSPTTDPPGPATGDGRVQRGGSWGHSTSNQRVANRHYRTPASVANDVGFRCAR